MIELPDEVCKYVTLYKGKDGELDYFCEGANDAVWLHDGPCCDKSCGLYEPLIAPEWPDNG